MARYDGAVIIQTDINTGPFDKGLQDMENHAKQFGGNLSRTLKAAMAGLGLGLSAVEITKMAGAMTDLESRAKIAAGGIEDVSHIMDRLRTIADRAYSPLEATATAFMNNSTALNSLGISIERQLDLTDALTNALVVSGAKGEQFEMVMNAINRSLAIGVMRGRELEMVQKYGGAAAEALAQHLGTTVAGLRDFATDGKITAQVIEQALVGSMEKFREQADAMPATIGDALTRLRNQFMATVADINKATDFEQTIVQNIDAVKEAIKEWTPAMGEAVKVAQALFVTVIGGKAFTALTKYGAAQLGAAKNTLANVQAEKIMMATKVQAVKVAETEVQKLERLRIEAQMSSRAKLQLARIEAQAYLEEAQAARAAQAAKVQKIQTQMAEVRAYHLSAAAKMHSAAQSGILAKMDRELTILSGQLAVAQNGLAVANGRVAAANSALSASTAVATAALTGLRTVATGILAFFGGPLGAAITAVAGATYYLATRQTEGEKVAKRYAKEIEALRKEMGWAKDEVNELGDAIETMTLRQLRKSIEEDEKAVASFRREIVRAITALEKYEITRKNIYGGRVMLGRFERVASLGFGTGIDELEEDFKRLLEVVARGEQEISPLLAEFEKKWGAEIEKLPETLRDEFGRALDIIEEAAPKLDIAARKVIQNIEEMMIKMHYAWVDPLPEIDWDALLNKPRTLTEELIALMENAGVKVRGVKFFDLTESISNLEQSQGKIKALVESMVDEINIRLNELRAAYAASVEDATRTDEVEQSLILIQQLTEEKIQIERNLQDYLDKTRTELVAKEKLAQLDIIESYKATAKEKIELQKQVVADLIRALSEEKEVTKEQVDALVELIKSTNLSADAKKEMAQEAYRAAIANAELVVELKRAAAQALLSGADMREYADAMNEVTAAIQRVKALQEGTADLGNIVFGGGGGRGRGGGAGGLDQRKKALEEVQLVLAKMEGNFERIREIEASRELESFNDLLKQAGIKGQEAAEYLERFNAARADKVNTEHLQEHLAFYEKLRNVMPSAAAEADRIKEKLLEMEIAQLRAIKVNEEFLESFRKWSQLRESKHFLDGVVVGLADYVSKLNWADQAQDFAKTSLDGLSSSLFDVVKGTKSASEAFGAMATAIVDALVKMMIQMLVIQPIAQGLMNMLGGFMGGASPVAGLGTKIAGIVAGVRHTGGIVGQDSAPQRVVDPFAFPWMERFHNGGIAGLRSGEVPAVLQRGEGIFTKAQMNNLTPISRQPVNIKQEVKVINPPGVPLKAGVSQKRASNGTMQTTVLLNTLEEGMSNRVRRGESRVARAIEERNSLNSYKNIHFRSG